MADIKFRPSPFLAWDTWADRLGVSVIILMLIVVAGCITFWSTFDYPVSRQDASCRLRSWGYWQPDGKGGSQFAHFVVKCNLADGELITLAQPLGWSPPDPGDEIKIEIVNNRLSGLSYYPK